MNSNSNKNSVSAERRIFDHVAHFISSKFVYSADYLFARRFNLPMVALESTIYTHGMPWPANLSTAHQVELRARKFGVIPITIAIIKGRIHIGLTDEELNSFAQLSHSEVRKCSVRDIPLAVSQRLNGSTTVAATLWIAERVGIDVFVTGGCGGVEKLNSFDISADLPQLSKSKVSLVCAGVKSILDIGATLEYLETSSVPVISFGQPEFPSFFTPKSKFISPMQLNSINEIAEFIWNSRCLNLAGGEMIAVPIQNEFSNDKVLADRIELATQKAAEELKSLNLLGREITPFMLKRINELTNGDSLKQNISLIVNNCTIGSQISWNLNQIQRNHYSLLFNHSSSSSSLFPPIVFGSSNFDVLGSQNHNEQFRLKTKNSGSITHCYGGVGRNMAEVLGRMNINPIFISAIGNDSIGNLLLSHCEMAGMNCKFIQKYNNHSTSIYMGIMQNGDLYTSIGDMKVLENISLKSTIKSIMNEFLHSPLILSDSNFSIEFLNELSNECYHYGIPLLIEGTSVEKCIRSELVLLNGKFDYFSPSELELIELHKKLIGNKNSNNNNNNNNSNNITLEQRACDIMNLIPPVSHSIHFFIKCGSSGSLLVSRFPNDSTPTHRIQRFSVLPNEKFPLNIVNTSGAGDSLVGGIVWYLIRSGTADLIKFIKSNNNNKEKLPISMEFINNFIWFDLCRAMEIGMRCAEMTIEAEESVSKLINEQIIIERQLKVNQLK